MSTTTMVAIYFLIWWVTLFAVLPWGMRSQEEDGVITPGTDPGAPAVHRVWSKLVWTTVVASIVFGFFYGLDAFGLIPYKFLESISNPPHR